MSKSNVLPFRRPDSAGATVAAPTQAEAGRQRALRSAILACLHDARVVIAIDKAIKEHRA